MRSPSTILQVAGRRPAPHSRTAVAGVRSRRHAGQTLIGLLVVVAILMILTAWYVPQLVGTSGPGEKRTPTERAYGTACTEYESQMNAASVMYKDDHDNHAPRSLNDLKPYGVNDEMINAQGCFFQLDPSSGRVTDVGRGRFRPVADVRAAKAVAKGFHPDDPATAIPDALPDVDDDGTIQQQQPASYPQQNNPEPTPTPAPNPKGTIGPGGIRIPNMQTSYPDL